MRIAFVSDIHFGEAQDLKAYAFAVKLLGEIQPDEIVLGGDIFDHGAVGKYRKNPEKAVCLQEELNIGKFQLGLLREACPGAKMAFYMGNHEKRLPHYMLDIATGLLSLDMLNPRHLYGLNDLGIQYIPETKPFKRGHLWIGHGDEFSTGGINPADKALNDVNSNILFGHVHRFSVSAKTQLNGRQVAGWSNGCLCSLTPDYVLQPDWVQGFTLIDMAKQGYFAVTPIRFWHDPKTRAMNTVIDGVFYDSRKGK